MILGTLPAGITFKAATGTFTSTPKAGTEGSYTIAITNTNTHTNTNTNTNSTITQNFTLTVTS
jgi:hypothetical protein